MRSLSRKKLLLIGFIVILLVAIPLTIFVIKQQQETRSRAEAATTMSFEPVSTVQTPLSKNTGDVINLDVIIDPGVNKNLVSFVRLEVLYDPAKLATGGATPQEKPFAEEPGVLTLLEGPIYSPGKITATLSVGVDPTKVIQTRTKIGTLTFTAIDVTTEPTEVKYGPATQVLSTGAGDSANENVLNFSGITSAFIAIAQGAGGASPTVTPTPPPGGVVTDTPTPSPTTGAGGPTATPSATPTGSPGTTGAANQAPVCSALNVDRSTTGNAPFSITFTASGTDTDGTITKVTFSYGDGQVENVTQGGGVNTSAVNASATHTYQNAGTYTASAVLTDNSGSISSGTCSQTITVNTVSGETGGTGSSEVAPTSSASLPATGPEDTFLTIGAVVTALSILGAAIFFIL